MSAIYFDHNSTTPVDEYVLEKMLPYFTEHFGNAASKTHSYGWIAEAAVERAREAVAATINALPKEIIFTSGATEAINIAITGAALAYKNKGNHIITCKTEHKAVHDTCETLKNAGYIISYLDVDSEGLIDLQQLDNLITQQTILVALMTANNETGVIQPIAEAGEICRKHGVVFFSDTTQAVGKIPVDVMEQNIHMASVSSHKIYGPKGIGALYIRKKNPRIVLEPILHGGGHERALRPGTLNVPGIIGLAAACEKAKQNLWEYGARMSALRTAFEQMLEKTLKVHINGSMRNRLPNTTNLYFEDVSISGLIKSVPLIAFSTGSACTSALPEPSHVLKAMGFSDDRIYSSARFSFGNGNTAEEVTEAVKMITGAVQNQQGQTTDR